MVLLAALRSVLAVLTVAIVAIVAPLVSATVGVASLYLAGAVTGDLAEVAFRGWLFGDAVGILIVTALLLSWSREAGGSAGRLWETPWLLVIGASAVLLAYLVFFGLSVARAWAIYPALVWAALAYRARGAAVALALAAIVAVVGTEVGLGPFARTGNGGPDLLLLQQFLAVTSATVLLLAAAVNERDSQARASRLT